MQDKLTPKKIRSQWLKLKPAYSKKLALGILITAALSGYNNPASCDAVVPFKGEGAVTLSYQYNDVGNHLYSTDAVNGTALGGGYVAKGKEAFLGDIDSHSLTFNLDYGLTDKLAFKFTVSGIAARYQGLDPETSLDNGDYHTSFQDAMFELRYMVITRPVVITPFIGFITPTNNYDTQGHSAIGRKLISGTLGTNIARDLSFLIPGVFVEGKYMYVLSEEVQNINLDRSQINFTLGYRATPTWSLLFFGNYNKVHGGVDWYGDVIAPSLMHAHDDDEQEDGHHHHEGSDFANNHDRLAATRQLRLGIGTSFLIMEDISLYIDSSRTIDGANTHASNMYTAALTWHF